MLNDFVYIRKKINPISIQSNEIVGSIKPSISDLEKLISLSIESCVDNFVLTNGKNTDIEKIIPDTEIEIKLYPLQLIASKYYETFETFLNSNSQEIPELEFYIYDLEFSSQSDTKPLKFQFYEKTVKLISFLKDISDYQKGNEIVFFQSKQLVLKTDYSFSDLSNLTDIDSVISHIKDSVDKEERRIIFTNELIASLLKVTEVKTRFSFLLKHFVDVTSNYHKSYTLYLEKYSYQKFKSEIDKEIIEYSKKIQAVINDAQTKLVAIPAAFLLIIGQFDLTGEKIYFNIALVLSAFVFSVLLDVLIRNQFSALDFVKDDIDRFKNSVDDKKIGILGNDFTNVFTKINSVHKKQKCYLNIIRFLVWLTPLFAVGLFILSLTNNTFICFLRTIFSRF